MTLLRTEVERSGGPSVDSRTADMVRIPGGTFRMGSDHHYPEEAPAHRVTVDSFWIDRTPVTNRQFKRFVIATGHETFAEIPPDPKDYPGALPHMLDAGSLVFVRPHSTYYLRDWSQWWTFMQGADWRHPYGPRSDINVLDDHPVVHVSYADALAYAKWAGKDLPTEAEWEFAARGGLDGAEFAWGDEFTPGGVHMANTWQGEFPLHNLREDGYERTSPVTAFPPNGYGVHDMIGNVWEWTADWYSPKHEADAPKACCIPENPRGGREEASLDPPARYQDPAQGHQGRLASLRAELLPALPPGGAPCRDGGHVNQPSWIQVREAQEGRRCELTPASDALPTRGPDRPATAVFGVHVRSPAADAPAHLRHRADRPRLPLPRLPLHPDQSAPHRTLRHLR